MTPLVDCYVGLLRRKQQYPPFPWHLSGIPIDQYFSAYSRDATGRSHIRLRMNLSRLGASIIPTTNLTDAAALESALTNLIWKQPPAGNPPRIGLILADRFHPRPSILGVMFDDGPFAGVSPREGCAIFLDAIWNFRKPEGPDAQLTEVGFTAVHELGHVFNLWHLEAAPNLMSTSVVPIFSRTAHYFVKQQRDYLAHNESFFVRPGGSAFGVRPNGWPKGDSPSPPNAPRRNRHTDESLRLHIDVKQREFWFFEPIELDIEIGARRKRENPHRIPDTIDPGYDAFQVWIEDPDGERRRYRACRRYCQNPSLIEVSSGHPFRRDISIFAQAGGYTFRASGRHRIEAVLKLPSGVILRSNTIEVELKPSHHRSRQYVALHDVVAQPNYARVLYHRSGRVRPKEVEALAELAYRYPRTPIAAGIFYALGVLRKKQATSRRSGRTTLARESEAFLLRAFDHNDLSSHRRRLSGHYLDLLRQAGDGPRLPVKHRPADGWGASGNDGGG